MFKQIRSIRGTFYADTTEDLKQFTRRLKNEFGADAWIGEPSECAEGDYRATFRIKLTGRDNS